MDVIPERLCELAEAFRAHSEILGDAWTGAADALRVEGAAAGNTPGGATLVAAHAAATTAAGTAIGRLAAVLEQDMDDLYACAFDFSATDEDQATRYESQLSRIGPLTIPVPRVDYGGLA